MPIMALYFVMSKVDSFLQIVKKKEEEATQYVIELHVLSSKVIWIPCFALS